MHDTLPEVLMLRQEEEDAKRRRRVAANKNTAMTARKLVAHRVHGSSSGPGRVGTGAGVAARSWATDSGAGVGAGAEKQDETREAGAAGIWKL